MSEAGDFLRRVSEADFDASDMSLLHQRMAAKKPSSSYAQKIQNELDQAGIAVRVEDGQEVLDADNERAAKQYGHEVQTRVQEGEHWVVVRSGDDMPEQINAAHRYLEKTHPEARVCIIQRPRDQWQFLVMFRSRKPSDDHVWHKGDWMGRADYDAVKHQDPSFFKSGVVDGNMIQYTKETEFFIQIGRGSSSYRTKQKVVGNLGRAMQVYNALNIGNGYKKRLIAPSLSTKLIAKDAS